MSKNKIYTKGKPMTYTEKLKDPRWQKKRLEILERDNWECQDCGLTNEQHILCFNKCLVVHNIDGENKKIKEINNQEENLISLCMRCHGKRHKINLEKYANVKRRKSRRCK